MAGSVRDLRRGVALIIVSWLVILLSLWAVLFLRESMVAGAASGHAAARLRAELACDSAIEVVAAFLSKEDGANGPGRPQPWADINEVETKLGAIEVAPGVSAGVVAYDVDRKQLRYGLVDEASKIHLMVATKEMLEKLPGMTAELAAAIVDWRDEDDEPEEGGAEDEVYRLLQGHPYSAKNGNFETLGELLLVYGMTPKILFGEDRNFNGRVDTPEDDGDETGVADDADGELNPGLWRYITLYSSEPNINARGEARIDLNTASEDELNEALGGQLTPQQIQVLLAARQGGGLTSVGQLGTLPQFGAEALKAIVDDVTVYSQDTVVGRVNVNTASREVLLALPGMNEEMADALISGREGRGNGLETVAWVIDAIGVDAYNTLSSWITTRSYQFRFQVQGWVGGVDEVSMENKDAPPVPRTHAFFRRLVVLDVAGDAPRLLYRRDLNRFGPLRFPERP